MSNKHALKSEGKREVNFLITVALKDQVKYYPFRIHLRNVMHKYIKLGGLKIIELLKILA